MNVGHDGNRSKLAQLKEWGSLRPRLPRGTPPLGFEPRSQAPQACSLSKLTYEGLQGKRALCLKSRIRIAAQSSPYCTPGALATILAPTSEKASI